MCHSLIYPGLITFAGQQTTRDIPAETDSQGSGARGQSHVPHLCVHQQPAGDVRDPHGLQRGTRHLDQPHPHGCGQV